MNTAIPEAEQLYWNIFETATDGLITNDLKTGRVLDASPAACALNLAKGNHDEKKDTLPIKR